MTIKTGKTVEKASILHEEIADGRSSRHQESRRETDEQLNSNTDVELQVVWDRDWHWWRVHGQRQSLHLFMLCIQLNACHGLKCVYFTFRVGKRMKSILPAYVNRGRSRFVIDTVSSSPDSPRLLQTLIYTRFFQFNWKPVSSVLKRLDIYIGALPSMAESTVKLFFSESRSFIDRESDIFNWAKLKISLRLKTTKVHPHEIRLQLTLYKRVSCVLKRKLRAMSWQQG